MIQVHLQEGGGVTVYLETRQPLVYMDQWALYRFATDEHLKARLLRVFETRGTLMFSWMNAAEIATLEGDSRTRVESLLTTIGVHWFPLDSNADAVMTREDQGRRLDAPLDDGFITRFYPHIHGQRVLSLSKILELTKNDIHGSKAHLESHKATLLAFFSERKEQVKRRPELARRFDAVPFEVDRPTRYVYREILRPLVTDPGFNPSKNDMVDVFHAVVAAAYCDAVLLDKKWASMVRKLGLPPSRLRIYDPGELDKFLEVMERAALAS